MSTLTKVFVVLLVAFSIAFTAMTVSTVAQTTNWKATAERYEEYARVADTNLRNLIAANAAELATARDAVRGNLERIGELERQVQAARNDVGQLTSELAKSAAEKTSAEAMSRGLLAQLQAAEAARNEYQKQRDELERQSIDIRQRNIDLNDRVNEQTAQLAVLQTEKRHSEQTINILKRENEKLGGQQGKVTTGMALEEVGGAAMKDVTALTPVASTPIRGSVREISGNVVTISVGAADGVKKDMVFVVYRGSQYVGDLKITMVDPNQAAGRMVSGTPAVGDSVTDSLRSGRRG